jgi:hypothetical protein
MRSPVDTAKIEALMRRLGELAKGPGRVYLTGGASALLEGWRASTLDVDIKLDPEPEGVFEAIAKLKDELDLNVELAAPDQFLPEVPSWRERSVYIGRHRSVEFFHYDFRAQALSKIARSHARDMADVEAMLERGLVTREEIRKACDAIAPGLVRFPGIDAEAFLARVDAVVRGGR